MTLTRRQVFSADGGETSPHPVSRALFVMNTKAGIIYVDPVGEPTANADCPSTDFILVRREHSNNFNEERPSALGGENAQLIAIPTVHSGCQCYRLMRWVNSNPNMSIHNTIVVVKTDGWYS